jgi:drug/metabolite transporter (DMT)-like permease
MLICGAVLTLAALIWGGQANARDGWPVYLLLAIFNVAPFYGLQTLAVLLMPSGTAAVVVYLQPVLVGFSFYPVSWARPSRRRRSWGSSSASAASSW